MKSDIQILEDLKERTKNLIWISESDYPFEVVMNPPIKLKLADSTQDLEDLFKTTTKLKKGMSVIERTMAHQN